MGRDGHRLDAPCGLIRLHFSEKESSPGVSETPAASASLSRKRNDVGGEVLHVDGLRDMEIVGRHRVFN